MYVYVYGTRVRDPEPGTRNPEPGTRDPGPGRAGTRDPEPGGDGSRARNPEKNDRFSEARAVVGQLARGHLPRRRAALLATGALLRVGAGLHALVVRARRDGPGRAGRRGRAGARAPRGHHRRLGRSGRRAAAAEAPERAQGHESESVHHPSSYDTRVTPAGCRPGNPRTGSWPCRQSPETPPAVRPRPRPPRRRGTRGRAW